MKNIRIGFIGAGLVAHGHALSLRSIIDSPVLREASAELCMVYDIDYQKASIFAEQHNVAAVATDVKEIFRNPGPDAIYICTPTANHKDYFLKAAESRKHVFVEKPLAFSTGEIKEMITAKNYASIIAQVGLVLRFEPVFWFIRQLIDQKKDSFGRLLNFYFRSDQEWPLCGSFHDSAWRSDPAAAFAGCLFEHSIHDVDLIRYLFGPSGDLTAYVGYRSINCACGIEDLAVVNFSLAGGATGTLTSMWHQIKERDVRRLEIFFERAVLILDDYKPGGLDLRYRELSLEVSGRPKQNITSAEVDQAYYDHIGSPALPFPDMVSAYRYQALAFLESLLGRREPFPGLEEALEAHQIIESAYAYARRNRQLLKISG